MSGIVSDTGDRSANKIDVAPALKEQAENTVVSSVDKKTKAHSAPDT